MLTTSKEGNKMMAINIISKRPTLKQKKGTKSRDKSYFGLKR